MALSAKYGLILSGLTGVGKSTFQNALIAEGCWAPRLLTSREVDVSESAVEHVPRVRLMDDIRSGTVVAPVIFADNLYAWPIADFRRLQTTPQGCVITTRPYTALLLAANIPNLIPVWLDLNEESRRERLAKRGAGRDRDRDLTERRLARDSEDFSYRDLFVLRVLSDEAALTILRQLVEGKYSEFSGPK